jgi:shikimate dehydrogenase
MFDFDAPPDRYAVMGNPVAHSLSPAIHSEFARQTRQRMVYEAIQVDPGGFPQAVGNFRAAGGKGLNVTLPFKQQAFIVVDRRSERAERAGAVNTIAFRAGGEAFGDNTDGAGLLHDLKVNLGIVIGSRRVLVIGAGGAVRGVLGPLLDERPAEMVIANRTVGRADELRKLFAAGTPVPISSSGFEDLQGRRFDVLINGTSASLQGETLPLPESVLAPGCWCYDMVYAARPTPFMRWAEARGAAGVADGLGMLVEQAAVSFEIWRGVRPETIPVIGWLRARFSAADSPHA